MPASLDWQFVESLRYIAANVWAGDLDVDDIIRATEAEINVNGGIAGSWGDPHTVKTLEDEDE